MERVEFNNEEFEALKKQIDSLYEQYYNKIVEFNNSKGFDADSFFWSRKIKKTAKYYAKKIQPLEARYNSMVDRYNGAMAKNRDQQFKAKAEKE